MSAVRHPLLVLCLMGSVAWGAYRAGRPTPQPSVVASAAVEQALAARFEQTHGRTPTAEERQAAAQDWIDLEILVREARELGLDRDDPIVRRRLAQKMRFVLEESKPTVDPGDAVLDAWRQEHADVYRRPARRGFLQAFVAAGADGDDDAQARAEAIQAALIAGADPAGQGDAWVHGARQPPVPHTKLVERYGASFAAGIEAVTLHEWVVLRSTLGWHVVRVDTEVPGRMPALDEIRERVLADWRQQQRQQNLNAGLAALRRRYAATAEGEGP